jgi:hypothetical protein
MRITRVSMRAGAIKVFCIHCHGFIDGSREPVYADLDGPAFEAYYHRQCLTPEQVLEADKAQER